MLQTDTLSKKRAAKLLSGEEVINLKNTSLKDIPSAFKEYAPNNSWLEKKQIQGTLEAYHSLIGCERIEKKSALSTAVWLANVGKAKVTKKTGKSWEVFGHTINSEDWLLPEEALFLLETNALELYRDDVPLSVEQTYTIVIGNYCSLQEYRVYSLLSRRGYRVLRHDKEITLTRYEKDIRLDQMSLVERRTAQENLTRRGDKETERSSPIVDKTDEAVDAGIPSTEAVSEGNPDDAGIKPAEGPVVPMEITPADSTDKNEAEAKNIQGGAKQVQAEEICGKRDADSTFRMEITGSTDKPHQVEANKGQAEKECVPNETFIRCEAGSELPVEIVSTDSTGKPDQVEAKKVQDRAKKDQAEEEYVHKETCIISDASSELPVEKVRRDSKDEPCQAMDVPDGTKKAQAEGGFVPNETCMISDASSELPVEADSIDDSNQGEARKVHAENLGSNKNRADAASESPMEITLVDSEDEHDEMEVQNMKQIPDHCNCQTEDMEEPRMIGAVSKKIMGSSPDILIIEAGDDVIEIDDDSDEHDDVVVMHVKTASNVDLVNLLESDESDDDVVFICQKPGSNDPSKWRRWFSTIPAFAASMANPQADESGQKETKIKMIDYFDLANKNINTIMKAIPDHNSSATFISAPDQRFIPTNILPKCAHYKIISTNSYDDTVRDRNSPESSNVLDADSHSESNINTSHSLEEIVRYGQEPSNFSRNSYGYSFHRTRNSNYRNNNSSSSGYRRFNQGHFNNGNNSFPVSRGGFPHNRFNRGGQNFRSDNSNHFNGSDGAQGELFLNESIHEYFNQNERNFPRVSGPDNGNNSGNLFQSSDNGHPRQRRNYHHNRGNFQNRQFDGNSRNNQYNNFPNQNSMSSQLNFALQQAYQMQFMAMTLIHGSEALMRNCGNLPNAMGNMDHFNPMSSFTLMGGTNSLMNLFNNNRGRSSYRRPYHRRPFGGRRRYYPNDREKREKGSPKVVEVVTVDSDEEDRKVKPELKRVAALSAIADLNSPKRLKLDETKKKVSCSEEQFVLKRETPEVKKEGGFIEKVVSIQEIITVNSDPPSPSSDMDVCEVQPATNVVSKSQEQVVSPSSSPDLEELLRGEPESLLNNRGMKNPTDSYDAEVVDAAKTLDVTADTAASALEDDPNANDIGSDLPSDVAPSLSSGLGHAVAHSWATYKKDIADHNDDQPSQSKSFKTLLSYDDERVSVKEVLKSLQIIGPIEETETRQEEIKVSYDVYLPNQPFKKSLKMIPNYRVIVTASFSFPSVLELNHLKTIYRDEVPFLFAVVYEDSVGFFNLNSISLPTLCEEFS